MYEDGRVCQPCQMSVTGVYEGGKVCQQCQVLLIVLY